MRRRLKVTTIRNYMSLMRNSMPPGQQPDNTLFPGAPRAGTP
ncbi:hypothetical protein [Streptomyces lunaelactis]|nr:hypothetical protein [Streptomyces lunaelactis]